MTDEDIEERVARTQRGIERICAATGIPQPAPWTAEQEIAFWERIRAGDAQVEAIIARRQARRDR